MNATLIIIADEVLLGRVTDTNTGTIARAMEEIGVHFARVETVHDDPAEIARAVRQACNETPLVLTTGGLGPTKDDMTKNVLTEVFGGELREDPAVMENIERIFQRKQLALNPLTRTQALVPTSCRVIQNPTGTAPIMVFGAEKGTMLISMPGVPGEVRSVLPEVVATVAQRFSKDENYGHRTCIVTGISESALAERLSDFEDSLDPALHLAYLPYSPIIKLRLDGHHTDTSALNHLLDNAFSQLHTVCGDLIIADDDISPAQIVLDILKKKALTLCSAESCTGGQIAAAFTAVPGASEVFNGGIVAYSNDVKTNVLGVKRETLEKFGAVSADTIREMLDGASQLTGSHCAIATSGIAGPGGGTPEKPVGTVWIGAKCRENYSITCLHLNGERHIITSRATTLAILNLLELLRRK